MSTQTFKCPRCGWVYPVASLKRSCKFCHAKFDLKLCPSCNIRKELKAFDRNYKICKECQKKKSLKPRKISKRYADEAYEGWLESVQDVPFKALSEQQWIEACRHFGGCAYCGKEEVEARNMFIPYIHGGRYAAWNVVPACNFCAGRRNRNPFRIFASQSVNKILTTDERRIERLQYILDYLRSHMHKELTDGEEQDYSVQRIYPQPDGPFKM